MFSEGRQETLPPQKHKGNRAGKGVGSKLRKTGLNMERLQSNITRISNEYVTAHQNLN
jgi:hypothetical protein